MRPALLRALALAAAGATLFVAASIAIHVAGEPPLRCPGGALSCPAWSWGVMTPLVLSGAILAAWGAAREERSALLAAAALVAAAWALNAAASLVGWSPAMRAAALRGDVWQSGVAALLAGGAYLAAARARRVP